MQIRITETLRTFERQAQLFSQGRTKPGKIVTNASPGQSNHHWGLALDCYPILDGELILNFDRSKAAMEVMRAVAALAKPNGIKWGIAPIGRPVKDMPHFEWHKMPSVTTCRKLWPQGWIPGTSKELIYYE
jgi:hypothetical protein